MAIHNVFVDTGAWYALFDKQDNNHNRAKEFYKTNTSPLFTSNFVVDEALTLLKNRIGIDTAITVGKKFFSQEITILLHITSELEKSAWQIFQKHCDKGFSFTDCTSFALMEKLRITAAFAFDVHYRQYGKFLIIP